jgi:short-subunit dehydrogenase
MRGRGKTALVTGASSGIGESLAKLLAADGYDLVVVARRRARLEALAQALTSQFNINVEVVVADLADPGAPELVFKQLQTQQRTIDVLINNAGLGGQVRFAESSYQSQVDMIQVNCVALVKLTHLFLPGMISRGSGKILNIGSYSGFFSGPTLALYFATKALVIHFSEAIAYEIQGTGVTVTVSCPGATRTDFAKEAGADKALAFNLIVADVDRVAKQCYRAMNRGKKVVVNGFSNWLTVQTLPLLPRWLQIAIIKFLLK